MFRFIRIFAVLIPLGVLAGCSATTLRCSSSAQGDSFVEMINLPQDLSGQVRNYANLCGFVYEKSQEPVARLNILDSASLVAQE
jgi:hypothetical protein